MRNLIRLFAILVFITGSFQIQAQDNSNEILNQLKKLERSNENLRHRLDQLSELSDDILWFQRVGVVAFIDKKRPITFLFSVFL